MKVLHVAAMLEGGAGRGLMGLHAGLLQKGIDSYVLSADKQSALEISNQIMLPPLSRTVTKGAMKLERLAGRVFFGKPTETFSFPFLPTFVSKTIKKIEPDVLHLHWIGNLMTPSQLASVSAHQKTVWTLRDLAPLTGGCHYSHECDRFTETCGRCPVLPRNFNLDASRWTMRRKINSGLATHVTPVALSEWLAKETRKSSLFRNQKVLVVNPGIDTSVFSPQNMASSRAQYSLPVDERLVGFIALSPFRDGRKGGRILEQALNLLNRNGCRMKAAVTVSDEELNESGVNKENWIPVGKVRNDEQLASLYSACDLIAVPSTQEAFGKVAIEAMACGKPVVTFANTGTQDAVQDRITGYLAKYAGAEELANGIYWVVNEALVYTTEKACREVAISKFSLDQQASSYLSIYQGD